jgi:type 1 fimbriae regulatory protein FimE
VQARPVPPRPRTDTIRFLTLDEIGRLLAATRESVRDWALFLLAYRHALRASEVGLLRAEALDRRALRLMMHRLKGSHSGTHPLRPDQAEAIRVWLREREQPPSPEPKWRLMTTVRKGPPTRGGAS